MSFCVDSLEFFMHNIKTSANEVVFRCNLEADFPRIGEGNSNPFQYSCLENSTGRGAWQATGVAKGRTQLSDYHFPLILA